MDGKKLMKLVEDFVKEKNPDVRVEAGHGHPAYQWHTVHIRDFQATLLHLFGIDHERFTVDLQGLPAELTGVEPARVVSEILA